MKIALACSVFPPEGSNGGMATFYLELSRALASLGHDVLVVTLTNAEDQSETVDGVRLERFHFDDEDYANLSTLGFLPFTSWYLSRAVHLHRRAAELIEDFAPDVFESPEHGFLGLLFQSAAHPLVIRCLCPAFQSMVLNGDDQRHPADWYLTSALEINFLRRADALTAPSKNLAGIVSDGTGIPAERFTIIKNPLACLDEQSPSDESYAEKSNAIAGMKSKTERKFPRLVFVGRVEQLKGCDLLVEMMPAVLKRFPDATLQVIGQEATAAGTDVPFSDQLRKRLEELDCVESVNFTGAVPRDQLQSMVSQSDLAIFPSRYDSSPYSCLETMSFGVPVLASNVGGIPEYIEHGVNGWLFPSENPARLADAVITLCSDSNLRLQLAAAGKESCLSQCNPLAVAKQTVEMYERTVSEFKNSTADGVKRIPIGEDKFVQALLSAFDDLVKTPYYRDRLNVDLQRVMQEVYQNGFTDGFQSGRHSIAANPAAAMMDGFKYLARSYKKKP